MSQICLAFHRIRVTSVSFYGTTLHIMMSEQFGTVESFPAPLLATLSPYSKFKMALKSREVQRQYPNLLERFLDFYIFEGVNVEQKSEFYRFVTSKSQDNVEDVIIRFVLSQKERIDRQEITAGTLRNHVKAIKLFCRMNRINLSWGNNSTLSSESETVF